MIKLVKDDTASAVSFVCVASGNPMQRKTGIGSWSCYYSVNGGSATAMTTPTITELDSTNMPGVYAIDIDESGMVGTVGQLLVNIKGDGAAHVGLNIRIDETVQTECEAAIDNNFYFDGGTGYALVDVRAISSDQNAADNLEKDYDGTGYNKSASTIGTATAATSVTNPVTAGTVSDKTGYALSSSGVDAIHDEVGTGHGGGGLTLFGYTSAIATYLASMTGTDNKCLVSTDAQNLSATFQVNASVANVTEINGESVTAKAGENLSLFFDNSGNTTAKIVDDVGTGSGGTADWTSGEKNQIRQALGVTGTTGATTGSGHLDAVKAKTDNLPSDPASETNVDANETKIDIIDGVVDAIKVKTDQLNFTGTDVKATLDSEQVTVATNNDKTGYGLANDAITSAKFDEVSAFPLKSADTGSTKIARTGADNDTLETLSDQMDTIDTNVDSILEDTGTTLPGTLSTIDGKVDTIDTVVDTIDTNVDAILVDTGTTLPASLTAVYNALKTEIDANEAKIDIIDTAVDAIKTKTDYLPDGIKKNTALSNFAFTMVDATDGFTVETGLTVTAQRIIDGGGLTSCVNSPSEIGSTGIYRIDLAAADLNGDVITLRFTATGAADHIVHIHTEQ